MPSLRCTVPYTLDYLFHWIPVVMATGRTEGLTINVSYVARRQENATTAVLSKLASIEPYFQDCVHCYPGPALSYSVHPGPAFRPENTMIKHHPITSD